MDGLNLPVNVLEDYIMRREHDGKWYVELATRQLVEDGGLYVSYHFPRGSRHPKSRDITLSATEVQKLTESL